MKRIYFISLLLIISTPSLACSCSYNESFCNTHTKYDITANGIVIDTISHGILIKVLYIWNGNENRDTIKVFDLGGPYDICNDSLYNTRASNLGNIGDTLIFALPKIDTIKNTWDVIGDYRKPGFTCEEYKLTVKNNIVKGFISGSIFCHFLNNCLTIYDYDSFKVDFPEKKLNCHTWLNIEEEPISSKLLNYYPNPATDNFIFDTSVRGIVTITNKIGQIV